MIISESINMFTRAHICVRTCVHACALARARVHTHMCVCTRARVRACMRPRVRACVRMCARACVHILRVVDVTHSFECVTPTT